MRTAILGLALLVVGTIASAQTTYISISVSGQPGEPRATFTFQNNLQLGVQCDFKRGLFVTNFGVYGQEAQGQFTLSCEEPFPFEFEVNNTPLTVTVPLVYVNGPNYGKSAGTVTLTVNSAEFTEQGRYHPATGSATITY